ncbi:MAG: RNA methyltransferase [Spirochaetales bacterium]|nr:RNA methyltransferase [Spirochaetales bacterium]
MTDPLISYLSGFISPERFERMKTVLSRRTEYLTVVLEDLHYSQNGSAVIRHCDAFGIQNLHVIENSNRFKVKNHAVRGTLKWIHLNRFNEGHNNSRTAVEKLKSDGYRIIATSPLAGGAAPGTFDLSAGPAALFFGNERDGLSREILDHADGYIQIPMEGFVESLNISASCAIILSRLGSRLRESDLSWQLPEKKYKELLVEWLKDSIKKIDYVMKDYPN